MKLDNRLRLAFRRTRERLSKKLHKMKYSKQINRHVASLRQIEANNQIDRLLADQRYADRKCLIRHGRKLYSQNQEDGMIQEIFSRIGTTNRVFVEFGIGDGLENNTLALLLQGWTGLWMDGSSRLVRNITDHFKSVIESGRLRLLEVFVTKENVDKLISSQIDDEEIDLLSIDIDGNDIHVFNSISTVNPRVVVIEYNAKFFPPIRFEVDYDPGHSWRLDDYMGASLTTIDESFRAKGYSLVGCDLAGVNAFYVRNDLIEDRFLAPFTVNNHYEPARYHLVGTGYGHPPTLRSVEKVLASCMRNFSDDR